MPSIASAVASKLLVHGELAAGSRTLRTPGSAASASISARDRGGVSAP
jgi:hypothetical protein